MKTTIYQIHVSLEEVQPQIWRQLLIPSNLLLSDLHNIIQTVMGWEDAHLHQFIKNKMYYTVQYPDDDFWDDDISIDYKKKKIRISDLLLKENEKIIYEYDFGDCWEHEILLEKILPIDNKQKYPVCLAGKMSCPPEDCGGAWGYMNMLEILNQPEHEEYNSYIDWLGDEFDPKYFDKDNINKSLHQQLLIR